MKDRARIEQPSDNKRKLEFGLDEVCHHCKGRGKEPNKRGVACTGCDGAGTTRKEAK